MLAGGGGVLGKRVEISGDVYAMAGDRAADLIGGGDAAGAEQGGDGLAFEGSVPLGFHGGVVLAWAAGRVHPTGTASSCPKKSGNTLRMDNIAPTLGGNHLRFAF